MSVKHPGLAALLAALLASAAVILAGCGTASSAPAPPATVQPVAGSQIPQLQLTSQAIHRLGIVTGPVRSAPGRTGHSKRIPYPAVIYGTDGSSWTYVNTAARTYRREPITITVIQGNVAILSSGPPVGTEVVTVGAPELLGTEYNISGEQ